ncbi:hypothetical protein C8R45DRAFT_1103896 [Mycena sanguinolenta]|nr:hypothetical protein C8R45DRAFT_1103896 [Mycena sanguinolenta]
MALLLSNLAPDVIFSIFAQCDVSSVISTSQTCRYLHNLAFDKSVWLILLDNLRRRSILDRTLEVETLSVAEMIGIVRRLITGPQTWSPGELDRNPVAEISKRIKLHPQSDPGNPGFVSVELLPSGCYILFCYGHTLQCWNVAADGVVWSHTPAVEHPVLVFGAEETDTSLAIIMIYGPMLFIEMVNVDLRTGTHNCLLAARAPDSGFIDKPVIYGALAAVRLDSGYMVISWRAKSYFIIRGHDSDSRFTLLPRHIVVLKSSVNGEPQIHLISNDTIGAFFIGLDDAEFSAVSVEEMPKLKTFHAISAQQSFAGSMQIHESPIRDADYRVWIWGGDDGLLSYQLSIPLDREPQWRVRRPCCRDRISCHTVVMSSTTNHFVGGGPSYLQVRRLQIHDSNSFVTRILPTSQRTLGQ